MGKDEEGVSKLLQLVKNPGKGVPEDVDEDDEDIRSPGDGADLSLRTREYGRPPSGGLPLNQWSCCNAQ